MAVISVSVTASDEQIMAGIPRTVTISTNISALIFYTLDGSVPNLLSTQYTGPITMPVGQLIILLNILATNGQDSSPIITETYQTDMVDGNVRFTRNNTNTPPGENLQPLFPFGEPDVHVLAKYGNPADVGVTVDNPALPATSTGFDGAGNSTGFTNHPFDLVNYNIRYSTQDAEGQMGPGIGNLPAKVTLPSQNPLPSIGPEETDQFSNVFNPQAFVIFQDLTKENPNDPATINRMYFTLENNERARDGNAYFNAGLDAPPVSGTFLRSHYNPRTNMNAYYYFDSWTNKWLISTQPYVNNGPWNGNMSGVAPGRGSNKVFEWLPFTRRVLF